jgi:hypothetical protein
VRSLPPYALITPEFRFRGLAALAGRTALGGARELIIGTLLGARLVEGVVGDHPLSTTLRRARATAAKTWLSALALPASTRSTLAKLAEATGGDDLTALKDAWEGAAALVVPTLDASSRAELRRLSSTLASAAA